MVFSEKENSNLKDESNNTGFQVDLENSASLDQKAQVHNGDSIQSDDSSSETPPIKTLKIERSLRQFELWLGRKFNIETRGIERVEEEDKEPPPLRNTFLMWWSMFCNPGGLPIGILGAQWGLSLQEAVIGTVFGTIIGAILVAWCGVMGSKLGLRSMATCRYSFGYHGAKLISILNLLLGIGYAVISTTVCGQLLPAAADYRISTSVGIYIVSALSLFISFFGFSLIHKFESYSWILAFVLFCVLLGQTVPYMTPEMVQFNPHRPGFAATFLSYLSFTAAGTSGWATAIGDYYCHYPKTVRPWKIMVLTIAGFSASSAFVSIVGTCVGLVALQSPEPRLQQAYALHGLGGIVQEISHPAGWAKFLVVMMLFTVLGGLIANYYSAGLSIQILGQHFRYIPRFIWSFVIAVLITVLSLLGKDHIVELIGNLGNMLGYLTAGYSVIVFMEDQWFRRRDGYDLKAWNNKHKLPWGLAAVGSVIVSYGAGAVPGMNTTWYIGPIAALFGNPAGDVGLILNTVFTAVTYFIFRTIEKHFVGR
ncbi:cytosine permease [Nannizzia gypsea CBS 118893]|uniref:Cytosine permease n=1 Tax=Arthroderma gypseum (strain ATCC MYA-4604 / CBS 118893) TaxID=535722 RepID=E4UUL0_ARTGP|nr:cytosine permease [Nannizzia gypsea CBS 118893]EFR00977.1 cytosine permease [Nannizzia gypsea CBS 118893]